MLHPAIERVALSGSRGLGGRPRPDSDVDLSLVVAPDALPAGEPEREQLLRAVLETSLSSFGGGYFAAPDVLCTNFHSEAFAQRVAEAGTLFRVDPAPSPDHAENLGVLYRRLERDGYRRLGPNWGTRRELPRPKYAVANDGDDGWGCRPSPRHPELQVHYTGYLEHGYTFAFQLDAYPRLLEGASWACWDSLGNLWAAWPGLVQLYTLKNMGRGSVKPAWELDVEPFEPPARPGGGQSNL